MDEIGYIVFNKLEPVVPREMIDVSRNSREKGINVNAATAHIYKAIAQTAP